MTHPALYPTSTTGGHHADDPTGHFVAEGLEDLNVGICPCGNVVVWDELAERWLPDPEKIVLILDRPDVEHLLADGLYIEDLEEPIRRQRDAQVEIASYHR
jgi:hypothetical protein